MSVMDRLGQLSSPYLMAQIEREATWTVYECSPNRSLTHCLALFGTVSVTSVRVLMAEIICGLEYLHSIFQRTVISF